MDGSGIKVPSLRTHENYWQKADFECDFPYWKLRFAVYEQHFHSVLVVEVSYLYIINSLHSQVMFRVYSVLKEIF